MDKIKAKFRQRFITLNIRASFVIYVALAMFLALTLTVLTFFIIDGYGDSVSFHVIQSQSDVSAIMAQDDKIIEFAINYDAVEGDYFDSFVVFYARNIVLVRALIIFIMSFAVLAAAMFYQTKIKKPLKLLKDGAEKISQKSLDFTVDYHSQDEMGELCRSFEVMRSSLEDNNKRMWAMIEEQRQIHDAFSHDIRTPLTVLCGYNDLLIERIPENQISDEMLMKTLHLMKDNLIRLENFTISMSKLQKLSDLTPEYFDTDLSLAYEMLKENTLMAADGSDIKFHYSTDRDFAILPVDVIKQIITNLVSNAQRFAKSKVDVLLSIENEELIVKVQDDGEGFSKAALEQAKNAYYSESNEHFGLGLHICTVLSHKLHGELEISNNNIGALVVFTCPITTEKDHQGKIEKYYK